jgi:integrase
MSRVAVDRRLDRQADLADWLRGVRIVRAVSDADGHAVVVKDTKTHATRRLALDLSTVEVFRRRRARAEEVAAASGGALVADAYVWSQAADGSIPYRPDRVTGAFIAARHSLKLDHLTFHTLRHFAATTLAGSGVGIRTIAGRLGHANPNVTLRTYAHFLEVAGRDAAAHLGGIVAALAPASGEEPETGTSADSAADAG